MTDFTSVRPDNLFPVKKMISLFGSFRPSMMYVSIHPRVKGLEKAQNLEMHVERYHFHFQILSNTFFLPSVSLLDEIDIGRSVSTWRIFFFFFNCDHFRNFRKGFSKRTRRIIFHGKYYTVINWDDHK